MNISCPQCKKTVAAEDASIHTAMANCRSCGHVFGFADQVANSFGGVKSKTAVSMPKGFHVHYEGHKFVLSRKWFTPALFFLVFFCAFWDGFLIFWYAAAMKTNAPAMAVFFPLIHVAVGVGLTYATVAGFLNTTWVSIDPMQVEVKHGPLPWPGNKIFLRADIKQFFCERKTMHTKNGGVKHSYSVRVIDQAGKKSKFISSLENLDQARFIEQELERQLGIKDIAIPEEAA